MYLVGLCLARLEMLKTCFLKARLKCNVHCGKSATNSIRCGAGLQFPCALVALLCFV